jgi:tRNA A-37 threonylcarbamoyl transferase component Bud32
LARLHEAGFTHPDLYAKHVFVDTASGEIAFIDFQRTQHRRRITWKARCRDLAALHASLGDQLANSRDRLLCLLAYLRAAGISNRRSGVRRASRHILRRTRHLVRRTKVRAMRAPLTIVTSIRHVEFCASGVGQTSELDQFPRRNGAG